MQSKTPELLRTAVAAGAYAEAERLLATYRSEIEAVWEAAGFGEQRDAIAAEVGALLQWARSTTLAARSHAQSKLIHLSRRSTYAQTTKKLDHLELDA